MANKKGTKTNFGHIPKMHKDEVLPKVEWTGAWRLNADGTRTPITVEEGFAPFPDPIINLPMPDKYYFDIGWEINKYCTEQGITPLQLIEAHKKGHQLR